MKKTASLNDNRFLRPDGSNLAAFLYLLREKHQEAYGLIRGTVQRVAPFFDDFQLEPARLKPDSIILEWRHKNSDAYFDATMRFPMELYGSSPWPLCFFNRTDIDHP